MKRRAQASHKGVDIVPSSFSNANVILLCLQQGHKVNNYHVLSTHFMPGAVPRVSYLLSVIEILLQFLIRVSREGKQVAGRRLWARAWLVGVKHVALRRVAPQDPGGRAI